MGETSGVKPAYNADNTVFAATKLGLVKDVYWVVPSLTSLSQESLDGFKEYLKKTYPAQTKEFDQLRLDGNSAKGTINGIPVFIVSLQDLPKIDKPVLLDIDLSFFSNIYQDENKTRILSLVSGFFKTLQESGLQSDMVTISASNKNGLVPYKFRFLADYFVELFANPKMLDGTPPKLWLDRADAWKMEQRSFKEAIPLYNNILKEFPKDAATHYDLSYAYLKEGNMEASRKEFNQAAALQAGYMPAAAELDNVLRAGSKN
jgi:tetratricopeptide (TPR) repeat protein